MSAKPRDLLKTRAQRVGEVLSNVHLKAGQANSQVILSGCDVTTWSDADEFATTAGEIVLGGVVVAIAATNNNEVAVGAATAAGEFRKVLIEAKADGSVVQVVGDKAATQATAKLPDGNTDAVSIGYLEVPASFTPGTTAVTTGMIKDAVYHGA